MTILQVNFWMIKYKNILIFAIQMVVSDLEKVVRGASAAW